MIKTQHQLNCSAPICADDKNKNTVWWAGEEICTKSGEVQKRQRRINKEFKEGGKLDRSWTLKELEQSRL
jgi:hypothetical protein